MQFSTILPVAISMLVTLVAGQNCPAKDVFDSCIITEMGYVSACGANDYGCLCAKWGDVLTCYLQCPSDQGYATALANKTAFCNSAAAYPSSSTAVAPTSRPVSSPVSSPSAASVASSSTPSGTNSASTNAAKPSGTSSSSAVGATSTGDAKKIVVGAGGLVLGLVAAVL